MKSDRKCRASLLCPTLLLLSLVRFTSAELHHQSEQLRLVESPSSSSAAAAFDRNRSEHSSSTDDNLTYLRPTVLHKYVQPPDEHELDAQTNFRLVSAYSAFYRDLQFAFDAFLFSLTSNAETFLKNAPISDRCFRSVLAVTEGLKNHAPWAIQST
jgi:hypothetical protein